MTTFIPDKIQLPTQVIPYFEDSQKENIPGRGTKKTVRALQGEVIEQLVLLGAGDVQFIPGKFPGDTPRYGFQVKFWFGGVPGRIDCAALPIRNETETRKDRALAQALYLLRDELRAMHFSTIHKPGAVPLIPYLIGANGKTVTEQLLETQGIPQLAAVAGR